MKRIIITGVNGLLGQKCLTEFKSGFQIIGVDIQDKPFSDDKFSYFKVDITNREATKDIILNEQPDYIINTAAYTNVNKAEFEKELCWKVNVEGVQNLAYSAQKTKSKIIHISTDYVFDGKNGPYKETDSPSPLGYYGKSKLAGENVLIQSDIDYAILRTMVLYGAGINIRPNFVTWLINNLKNKKKVTIVTDQYGNPTLANDLARMIKKVIEKKKWDIFHASGSELLDRYSFAMKIAAFFNFDSNLIQPVTTAELNQNAPRPLNSGFILGKINHELNFKPLNINESLKILKSQLKKLKQI